MQRCLTLEEAQEVILRNVPAVDSQTIPLWSALGNVLRQDIVSDVDHPTADISIRDGYCFDASVTAKASAATPARIIRKGTVTAGVRPDFKLGPGECAKIATGAVLPEGANAVAMDEEVELEGDCIVISRPVAAGEYARNRGAILEKGETVYRAGRLLTPSAIGLLAAFGIEMVPVSREVQVGVLATGDELIHHTAFPDEGKVRASSARLLTALADEMWLGVFDAQIASDSLGNIGRHIKNCVGCDAIIVTGGTGRGERDLVSKCLKRMGAQLMVDGLNMKPGKSAVFARLDKQVVFCLPGSPIGCFVLFHMLVRPALLAMMGCGQPQPIPIRGRWIPSTRELPRVRVLMPSRLLPDLGVEPLGRGELGSVVGLAEANSIVSLPEDMDRVRHDQPVDVYPVGSVPWTGA